MKNVLFLFAFTANHFAFSQTSTVDYFKQVLPGDAPKIFAPGTISNGFANRDFTISPTGDEFFFTVQQSNLVSVVMNSIKRNGKWSEPAVALFSGIYNDLEASFTADGNRIFFSSNRPLTPGDSTDDYNI